MKQPFVFESFFQNSALHLNHMVDGHGCTYFDVFKTSPAEAVADSPDFVDLPARYWEAAALVNDSCGIHVASTSRLRRFLLSHFREDGLAHRSDSSFSKPDAELFDQSRLMHALVTWGMHKPEDAEVRSRLLELCDGLIQLATLENDYAYIGQIGVYFGGTLIRPLTQAGLLLGEGRYIDFARLLGIGIIDHSDHFLPDGSFEGHMHGNLGTLAGIAAIGILDGNDRLLKKVAGIFEYARSISTEHGFVPELAKRKDDLIACETCAIMDYLDVALLLARHVDSSYWGLVEKVTRNHLAQSQIPDRRWLDFSDDAPDEEGIVRKGLQKKLAGHLPVGVRPMPCWLTKKRFGRNGCRLRPCKRATWARSGPCKIAVPGQAFAPCIRYEVML